MSKVICDEWSRRLVIWVARNFFTSPLLLPPSSLPRFAVPIQLDCPDPSRLSSPRHRRQRQNCHDHALTSEEGFARRARSRSGLSTRVATSVQVPSSPRAPRQAFHLDSVVCVPSFHCASTPLFLFPLFLPTAIACPVCLSCRACLHDGPCARLVPVRVVQNCANLVAGKKDG
jgi:hypothetical protein